jgi:16S rRNA processing protein RimM
MPDSGTHSEDWVAISRLLHTQGNRGELFGEILTDFPERFESLEKVTLSTPAGAFREFTVEYTRWHKKGIVFKLDGIESISEAETLVGSGILVDSAHLTPLTEGTYYQFELVGCQACSEAGQNLGIVVRVDDFGGNQLLVVQPETESEEEFWVPFSKEHILEVDCSGKRVTMRVPEDLARLNCKA